eukprot:187973-Alexandrium_andersonii.AAC.1
MRLQTPESCRRCWCGAGPFDHRLRSPESSRSSEHPSCGRAACGPRGRALPLVLVSARPPDAEEHPSCGRAAC